jgi:hypothetical protein
MDSIDEMKSLTKEQIGHLAIRNILLECSLMRNRRLICIEQLFKERVRMHVEEQDAGGYSDDVWEFPEARAAMLALLMWGEKDEPGGWDRHPSSGRYRIGGHAHMEYVCFNSDDPIEHVTHALGVTIRKDGVLLGIIEQSKHIGSSFPKDTRCFYAHSHTIEGEEAEWFVYHHWDRSVVIELAQSTHIMLSNVIERLGNNDG